MVKSKVLLEKNGHWFGLSEHYYLFVNISILWGEEAIQCPRNRHDIIKPNPPLWDMLCKEHQPKHTRLFQRCDILLNDKNKKILKIKLTEAGIMKPEKILEFWLKNDDSMKATWTFGVKEIRSIPR